MIFVRVDKTVDQIEKENYMLNIGEFNFIIGVLRQLGAIQNFFTGELLPLGDQALKFLTLSTIIVIERALGGEEGGSQ